MAGNTSAAAVYGKQFFKLTYLANTSCLHCNEEASEVLQFDHRDPKTKIANISSMITGNYSFLELQQEIDKCDVLCANCHQRKTAIDRNHFKSNYHTGATLQDIANQYKGKTLQDIANDFATMHEMSRKILPSNPSDAWIAEHGKLRDSIDKD